jgi:alpha-amylase
MKTRMFLLVALILAVILSGCQSDGGETAVPIPTDTPMSQTASENWWNDAVFYEVFVRSYYDSDGDGVGDINGLIERLDYLNDGDPTTTDDLGITGIWLMPIMESPSYHGYDVIDYYKVDEEYGTEEDFRRLMTEAEKRGIKVIVDLVLNHTSAQHPWFTEARADENAEDRDWYVWEEENPGWRGPEGQQVWHGSPTGYYYGVFWDQMPDLNLTNEATTTEMQEIARYWLEDMGADGFRLDAIKHLIEEGQKQINTESTHAWMQEFNAVYKEANPEAFAIGEVWSPTFEVVKYIGDEVDAAFEFDLAQAILGGVLTGETRPIARAYRKVVEDYPPGQYGVFLTNHDQNRVMSQLQGDENRAKLAATILLTSPGVPFIYYGEEIGQSGVKPDEDIRRPLQWDSSENAGFTAGSPWRPPYEDYKERNISAQTEDPDSLLSHYRNLIHLRQEHEALQTGDWTQVDTNQFRTYAFLRHNEDEAILVLLNLGMDPVEDFELMLENGLFDGAVQAISLYGPEDPTSPIIDESGGFAGYKPFASLPPQSSAIIQLTIDN